MDGKVSICQTGFSAILGSVLVACNNHSFLMHRSVIDCTGFGFRLRVGSRFVQCASHVILLVDGKLTKAVSRNTGRSRS